MWIVVNACKRKIKMHISTHERKKNTQLQIPHHTRHTHTNIYSTHGVRSKIKYICYSFNNHELSFALSHSLWIQKRARAKAARETSEKNTDGKKNNSFELFFRGLLREMQTKKEKFFFSVSFF